MTTMNFKRVALLLLLGLPLGPVLAEDLPKPYTFARYQSMMDRSPFAVATAVVPVTAPSFAKDLYVANAMRSKEEGDLVTIASSTDKNFKRYLKSTATVDGYTITAIDWSEKVGATKVTISKDGQTATLGFNEALLRSPVAGGNPAAQPAMKQDQQQPPPAAPPPAAVVPGVAPGVAPAVPAIKPMPVPTLPTPPPRVRGVIPRNPAANNPPSAALTPEPKETEL
jgi:hypothetical protein